MHKQKIYKRKNRGSFLGGQAIDIIETYKNKYMNRQK